MKKPLPLTMVPPTRTAGLKKYGKISARRWRKSRSTSYGMWRTVLWKKHGHGSFITLRKDVLRETAAIYNAVSEEVPETVEVLFENIFWPGLCRLLPSEIDYFFSLLKGSNVGLVLDTGHFMNTNPDLETEADGAEYICAMAEKLGSMKKLFRGMHLSCSLSGKYQKSCTAVPPENMDGETVMMHITSIDQHRPFTTEAARKIVECIEPAYLTHELFGDYGEISKEKLKIQMAAIGADGKGGKPISLCG